MTGKLICGRYQMVQIINQGMFCQTYIARDITIADYPTCVVKHFLPSDRIALPVKTRRRLFTREVEALTKLDKYEYVPHLLNHFEHNQEFYLVQEFIKGNSLAAELQPGKRWSETQVIQLLQEVLGILIFVHARGLIHRDVKPSNIMRRKQDNRLVLIDFGAVKPLWNELLKNQQNAEKFTSCDSTTIAIGTPGYMPYEQHQGRPVPSSDIYALGMIGIQALTGVYPTKLPEDPNTSEVIWQHLVNIDTRLSSVINKMVCYHSNNRYKSATEALAALTQLSNLYSLTQSNAALPSANVTPLAKQNHSVFTDGLLTPESAELSSNLSDSIESSTLVPPSNFYPEELDEQIKTALESETIISIFPDKSALFIGLVIGVVSGLALIILSYFSMLTIYTTPKLQNSQMQTPPRSR